MGSLMAGWDSPVRDPDDVAKYRRNKSLTKEEIEAFWKSKKVKEEEHLRDIALLSPRSQQKMIFDEAIMEDLMEGDANLEKLVLKHGWWTSTNNAFLNEPPVLGPNGGAHKYASQYHVADIVGSDVSHDPAGISA